jgi:hypothetical protein
MDNQVVPKLPGKLTKLKYETLATKYSGSSQKCYCTYPIMLTLGCFSDLSPDWEFILSHDRFVGFRSIRQKHHNYGAQ